MKQRGGRSLTTLNDRRINFGLSAVLAGALVLALPTAPAAHEIPSDAIVHVFVKPAGTRLRLLVRVPLEAMRDIEFAQRGPGYLDIAEVGPHLHSAATTWLVNEIELYENGERLGRPEIMAVRVSVPFDRSFGSYDDALRLLTGPSLPADTELPWQQALMDVLFEVAISSDAADFSIDLGLDRLALRVMTVLRFLPPGGAERAFQYQGDPGLVRLDPRWHQAAWRFIVLGFFHILDGIDHLLFLLCLVIPFRRIRPLVMLVTAFTLGHSITLMASAFGMAPNALWFPPLVETLIAVSIVYMALENILGASLHRRWLITLGFGLVHGFGFSFALRETLQFGGGHLVTSLLSFNVGVELGQLLALTLLVPALTVLFRFVVAERMGIIILSALVAHTGWHWMTQRGSRLGQYQVRWPALDATFVVGAMRWLMLGLLLVGSAWFLSGFLRSWAEREPEEEGLEAREPG